MFRRLEKLLPMKEHTCPWWFGYTFDNPLRSLLHKPEQILGGWVKEGDTAADLGCGGGHFSLGLARLVGDRGKVIAVDVQERMLRRVGRRARRLGLDDVIDLRLCDARTLGLTDALDFALAFWMVHEVPDQEAFLIEVRSVLKPSGLFLIAEPRGHVPSSRFEGTVNLAGSMGFKIVSKPRISFSRAVVIAGTGG